MRTRTMLWRRPPRRAADPTPSARLRVLPVREAGDGAGDGSRRRIVGFAVVGGRPWSAVAFVPVAGAAAADGKAVDGGAEEQRARAIAAEIAADVGALAHYAGGAGVQDLRGSSPAQAFEL